MNKCLAFTFLFSILSSLVYSQYTSIPDANFEAALSAYDDIPGDGQVPTANISSLNQITVSNQGISNITGIEDFVSLTGLNCQQNMISSIDLSTLPALRGLLISDNLLTTLDLSSNPSS